MPKNEKKSVIFPEFYRGEGISRWDRTGYDALINCNIYAEAGSITCNLALVKDVSANVPDEACILVTVPDGTVYALSQSSGKIWKRTTGGTWSLAHTNGNTAGHKGGHYHEGYLYYSTAAKLGRYDLVTTWTDSWQTYTNGSSYKPMVVSLLSLMIGDGKFLASVDNAGTFTANALDIGEQLSVTTVEDIETDSFFGTIASSECHEAMFYRWDNFSSSWWDEKKVKDKGVNCVIESEEIVLTQYGEKGKIGYLPSGAGARQVKLDKLRGVTTRVEHYQGTCFEGKALMAVGKYVHSVYRDSPKLPWAKSREYTCSQADGVFNSITVTGSQIIVSWTDGASHGIDILSTDKATAIIETSVKVGKFARLKAFYDTLPTNTFITVKSKKDGASNWSSALDTEDDTEDEQNIYTKDDLLNKRSIQLQITLTPSGATAPVLTLLELLR